MFRSSLFLLALCVTARCGHSSALPAGEPGRAAPDKGEKKWQPKFTIGKETTYVTGPLRKDGTIDYAAALNEWLSKGVTPENNANVLFWKAFGPHPEGPTIPAEFFKLLGYQPPERGDYFISLLPYLKNRLRVEGRKQVDKIFEQIAQATQRPWTAQEYPRIASWLKANGHPLTLVAEGTRRRYFFSPLVTPKEGGLIQALDCGVQQCCFLAQALCARAMLRVAQGRHDEAWQDLLACHSLGRLVARGGTMIDELVGVAIDSSASSADLAYLAHARLTGTQIMACLHDLKRLPHMPAVADKVNLHERFLFLETMSLLAHGGPDALAALIEDRTSKAPTLEEKAALAKIDWDPALRSGNREYERVVAALRLQDRQRRENELDKQIEDIESRVKRMASEKKAKTIPVLGSHPQLLAGIHVGLWTAGVRKVIHASDRVTQIESNLHVAFALAAYRAEHGRYPMKLDALAPKYFRQVPQDLFSGKPLLYRPSANGYLLYSVGVNGKNDRGRMETDDPAADDLVVRMPLPELHRK